MMRLCNNPKRPLDFDIAKLQQAEYRYSYEPTFKQATRLINSAFS